MYKHLFLLFNEVKKMSRGLDRGVNITPSRPIDKDNLYRSVPLDERIELFRQQKLSKGKDKLLYELARDVSIITRLNTLERGFLPRLVTVTTKPTILYQSPKPRGIIVTNPQVAIGLTTSGTLLVNANRTGTGNTQLAPLGVGNFGEIKLFLDITAVAGGGTVVIDVQTQDPLTGNWAISQQDIFTALGAIGTFYADIGSFGVDQNFAISFNVAVGSVDFSVSHVLKNGLPGNTTGLAQTIFLGGSSGVTTTSGFPLVAGEQLKFFLRENTPLFGVGLASISAKIFELS